MTNAKNILVINDEAHHAWRANPEAMGKYIRQRDLKDSAEEATIWIGGLDRINKTRGILRCHDFSATPFYPSGKKVSEELKPPEVRVEAENPWAIKPPYAPSPRQYLLEGEMSGEFIKIQNELFRQVVKRLTKEDLTNVETKFKVLSAVITETFGHMGQKALAYSGKSVGDSQVKRVVDRSLTTYMREDKAGESTNVFMNLANILFKTGETEKQGAVDEEVLSKNLMNYFKDRNQVMLREIKNRHKIGDKDLTSDAIKKEILMEMIPYYFGLMSKRYIDHGYKRIESSGLRDLDDKDRVRLMSAVIYDCLYSSMTRENAEKAYLSMKELLGL
jgi:hypothetical protein